MNDGAADETTSKLAELLKHPDDLEKIASLKGEFSRKKAAIDGQLKLGLKEQLEITQNGMTAISDGQRTVNLIKEEMMKIDKLCAEAQGMIRDFPEINKMSVMQRNFSMVEETKRNIDDFGMRLGELEELLRDDDQDLENQPNLLGIHVGLSQLRDVRDQSMDQVKSAEDSTDSGLELIENLQLEMGATLRDHFTRLDDVVDWFDDHVGQACLNLIQLVQTGNNGMVVRLGLIIEEEEKKDRKVKALQDAQKEFQDVASRFKSINVGQRELRGYKEKFLQAIEFSTQAQFDQTLQSFLQEPDKLDKSTRWYFNDLNAVKLGLVPLLPKKWKVFKTYVNIYHKLMHNFLVGRLDDEQTTPVHLLAIIHWVSKYYLKMERLGVSESELQPHVIDDREADLVRDYRSLITKAVEQWMDRMAATDRQTFLSRAENSLDTDAEGQFHTKTLGDMWRMLREQLSVAESSERPDVVEGVIDAMMRALKNRQSMWERLADQEAAKFSGSADPSVMEGFNTLQDWLVAIANDQITNIDDHEQAGTVSFLTRFRRDYEPLVSPPYAVSSTAELDALRDGYVDLGTHCISLFTSLIFAVDFRSILAEFFTPAWYKGQAMKQIITTFEDYLNDYTPVLHPSLRDVFVEELADELLVRYLSCMRNKQAKFRRQDPFTDKIKEDIVTIFNFFNQFPDSFDPIKQKWRAVNATVELLSADKGQGVVEAYEQFKTGWWDVQMGWVEAVLRARDDFDRSMLSSVKSRAAELYVERGPDTVMSKVK